LDNNEVEGLLQAGFQQSPPYLQVFLSNCTNFLCHRVPEEKLHWYKMHKGTNTLVIIKIAFSSFKKKKIKIFKLFQHSFSTIQLTDLELLKVRSD